MTRSDRFAHQMGGRYRLIWFECLSSSEYKRSDSMAKPIVIGLELHGEDARRFHKYIEKPTITEEGRQLIREAVRRAPLDRL